MPIKTITHQSVKTTFKVSPRNGIGGTWNRMLKPQNLGQQIGLLFEHLVKHIFEDQTALTEKSSFSLINITNTIQFSSVGYASTPPQETIGKNPGLVFTFALSASPYKKEVPSEIKIHKEHEQADLVSYWSYKNNKYLTISLDKDTLRDFKLSINTHDGMLYVYNCIGILTKSYVLKDSWYTGPTRNYFPSNAGIDETSAWSLYLEKPLRTMVNEVPLNRWVYCLEFWTRCSNLLTSRFLNVEEFGLYYILYLHERVPASRTDIYTSLHQNVGGLRDFITKGIQDFNKAISNPLAPVSDNCYAVVHLLEALVEPGGLGISVDKDFARERVNYLAQVLENKDLASAFYGFMNSSSVYESLLDRDVSFSRVMEKIL